MQAAPFWRRLAAILYDTVVVFAIWMLVGFVVLSSFGIEGTVTAEGEKVVLDPLYRIVLFTSMMLSAYLFFAWFWTRSGQTIGMQAWKIKIQNEDGSPITYKQSMVRFILAGISFVFLGLGHFSMLLNAQRLSLHDKASDSYVVKIT